VLTVAELIAMPDTADAIQFARELYLSIDNTAMEAALGTDTCPVLFGGDKAASLIYYTSTLMALANAGGLLAESSPTFAGIFGHLVAPSSYHLARHVCEIVMAHELDNLKS
jgi:hypothetical protein